MINLVIDDSFSIINASTSFYLFVKKATTQTLKDFLDEESINSLEQVMKTEGKSQVIKIKCGEEFVEVLMVVKKKNDDYNISLYDVNKLNEEYDKTKKKIFEDVFELLNTLTFTYFKSEDLIRLFSTNDNIIFEGTLKKFSKNHKEFGEEFLKSLCNFEEMYDSVYKDYMINSSIINDNIIIGNIVKEEFDDFYERDFLTGLLTKKALIEIAEKKVQEGNKTLLMIDMDNFKIVNDTYGHKIGDDIIKIIASEVKKSVGKLGHVGRYGGDEIFAIIYTDDELHIRAVCESMRLCSLIKTYEFIKMPVGLSIGVASSLKDGKTYNELFEIADKCLYIAKNKGKNRYIIYDVKKHGSVVKTNYTDSYCESDVIINTYKEIIKETDKSKKLSSICKIIKEKLAFDEINVYINNECIYSNCKHKYKGILDKEYLEYFDKNGVYVLENTMPVLSYNPSAYRLYEEQGVNSFIQVLIKDSNKVNGYFSFEVKKEKKAFNKSTISCVYVITNMIKDLFL